MASFTSLEMIDSFLAGHRIALVGASRDSKDFTRAMMRELLVQGYDVVPVNPAASEGRLEIEGRPVYRRLTEVPGELDGALVMTPSEITPDVARDALEAKVPRVWMHRGVGRGALNEEAVALLRSRGVEVVAGECPFMFMGHPAGGHRLHGMIRRLFGRYPRHYGTTASPRSA
jgi:uncharacterized protein